MTMNRRKQTERGRKLPNAEQKLRPTFVSTHPALS